MCGVVGLIGSPDASREAFLGLTTLQHRGQDAAGILSYDSSGFHCVKNRGLVESVFTRENMKALSGNIALGHARYSTAGRGEIIEVQPFLLSYPFGLGMVHNGNIVNVFDLADQLKNKNRRRLLTQSDTEVILNLFAEGLASYPTPRCPEGTEVESTEVNFDRICYAVTGIMERVNGSYSIATMIADQGLVAFRDPNGNRPLVWGKKKLENGEDAYMVASESVALSFLGYSNIQDVNPGEILFIDLERRVHQRQLQTQKIQPRSRPCMFEWVYFASPESVIDGTPVYGSRIQLGKKLAGLIQKKIAERQLNPDIVVPIPETSRIAAIALSEELKIPYREVLIKNRYIKRTFILETQEKRQKAVNLKLSPVRSEIEGKRVLLVDDSIVRGTTSKKIIELVRNAGASEVYFVSTCPPIKHPCFYGIDFPLESELIASGRTLKQIEEELGADAVIYQDIEGLKKSIHEASLTYKEIQPCTACLNGKYLTDVSMGTRWASARSLARNSNQSDQNDKSQGAP